MVPAVFPWVKRISAGVGGPYAGPGYLALLVTAAAAGCRPAPAQVVGETRTLMGTDVTVKVVVRDVAEAEGLVGAAFAAIQAVDRTMSTYRPDSELMRMNAGAYAAPVQVSPDLFTVLAASEAVSRLTGGAFDVTCGPAVDLWRSAGRTGRPPTDEERTQVLARMGYAKMHLDRAERTVRFETAGMKVDLGGVAKGYAVDQAVAALRQRGATDALVEAGGDLMAIGTAPVGRPWRIGVQDPRAPTAQDLVTTLAVRERAVVTSGNYRRFTEIAGTRYSHIIDPLTALPVDLVPSVTVIARDATTADALATAISVLGRERGLALVEADPDLECLLVTIRDGDLVLHRSSGFAAYETAE